MDISSVNKEGLDDVECHFTPKACFIYSLLSCSHSSMPSCYQGNFSCKVICIKIFGALNKIAAQTLGCEEG